MELRSILLQQLEREAEASRKVLERVPEGQNQWKPHERSMELGHLAALVASMANWPSFMIRQDEIDLQSEAGAGLRPQVVETRAELLRALDEGLARSREALRTTTDEHLSHRWRVVANGQVLSEGPRSVMILNSALSHMAHHRGQLTVYLRLRDAKVPAVYGPSADEGR